MKRVHFFLAGLSLCFASIAFGQNYSNTSNFLHSISEIERKLPAENFEIFRIRDLRYSGDINKRVILKFADNTLIQVKWKRAPQGGADYNNEPRYEVAAYLFQKLFLEPDAYVVPPTVIRGMPYAHYKSIDADGLRTFDNPALVFFALQYWLEHVDTENIFDKDRFAADSVYAKHIGNLNIFTYLIRHSDTNEGNFLISTIEGNPRVFAVDNGVAFASERSDRGYEWQNLRVDRLPAEPIARLRKITSQAIFAALETVVQFEIQYGLPVPVIATDNLDPKKGVRRADNIIQFGLTEKEIEDIISRLAKLLARIDAGDISVF